jgi:hypothetical protein
VQCKCLLLTQSGHWSEGELASQICEVFNFEQTLFLSESILPWLFGEEFTHAIAANAQLRADEAAYRPATMPRRWGVRVASSGRLRS